MTERQRKALSTHILKPWTFLDITHRRCTLECKWISWIRHKRVFTLSAPHYKVHMISGWTMWELQRLFNSLEILSCALPPACFAQVPPLVKTRQNVCSNENASYMKRYMRWQPIPLIMSTVCLSSKIHKYFFFYLKANKVTTLHMFKSLYTGFQYV